jgi:hypothetical protein
MDTCGPVRIYVAPCAYVALCAWTSLPPKPPATQKQKLDSHKGFLE